MELQRQVVIELERMERMPDQIDQLPELLAVAYPCLQLRKEVEPAPVFIAELVKTRAVRQQFSGTVKDAPPHRFRELFPAGTLKPRARIMLDGPKPVAERKITRIDLFFKGPVTRQQPTPHRGVIRYFAIMEQSRLVP